MVYMINPFKIEFIVSKELTSKIKYLVFKIIDKHFEFIPGQFITFIFKNINDKIIRRSYSIANFNKKNYSIEIVISYVKNGFCSKIFSNTKAGDIFNIIGPFGKFILNNTEYPEKLFLIGTGTGIVPYRSMLPILAVSKIKNIYIICGARYKKDIIYLEEFNRYSKKYTHINYILCLSREINNGFKGYVQNYFQYLSLNHLNNIVYLCGNPNMIDESFFILQNTYNFNHKSIRREKYISPK